MSITTTVKAPLFHQQAVYRLYIGTGPQLTWEFRDSDNNPDLRMMRYRIIKTLEQWEVEGATILDGIGIWQGVSEPALVVEVIAVGDHEDDELIHILASNLRGWFCQDSVLVTKQTVGVEFVTRATPCLTKVG